MITKLDNVILSTVFNFWYDKYEELFPLASDESIRQLAQLQEYTLRLHRDTREHINEYLNVINDIFKKLCIDSKFSIRQTVMAYHQAEKYLDEILTIVTRYINDND